ncbi:hypothetical protein [Rathayibacter iranicus]|uniref:Lipoprotein n=4 Tax=Rathayibacter iranicus TaxID=59737 RepID=A0AAD1ENF5_9MICO|nr:hypothetical protein [Rathayibacter iranicus]AZZ56670.1 hypothetical protein C7V51_12880 [Rathayibacter iranicus]PPI43315.1 hypothetical protein C5E09_11800 [Rathayibacter iranicus]PPI58258.1 hypothetical protein C5E08_12715 [Rathayibacter iranicus]PPI69373.1 hypothetical protein C5E01_11760 [Rathayibacter iranicus]PWJ63643.1 hypothetical protein B0H03_107112 [Rathayibacter iranicus NCPPB 2253 = VKM Ac-1602]
MTSTITTLTKKIVLLSSSVALGTLLLSGCSAGATDGPTAEPTMSIEDSRSVALTYTRQKDEYKTKLSDCLGKKGVTESDNASADASDAAHSACVDEIGDPPVPTAEQAAGLATMSRALTSCLKDKGHKVPDLKADGQWDDGEMDRLSKSDTTLNSDAMACFKTLSE